MQPSFAQAIPTVSVNPPRTSAVAAAFIVAVASTGGFTLLPVTLPALATAFELTPGQVGTVSTLELVGVTLGAFVAGFISRRLPSRAFALVTMAVLLTCALLTMFVASLAALSAIRFVDGLAAGAGLSIGFSVINTLRRPDRGFALLAVFPLIYGTIAFAVVPPFENLVSWHASFIVLSVTDAVALLAAFFLVVQLSATGTRLSLRDSLPNRRGVVALLSVVIYYAGVVAIYSFSFNIGLQMTGSEGLTGTLLSVSQMVGIVGCILAALLAGRWSRQTAIISGFAVTVAGIGFLLLGTDTAAFAIGLLAINFAWNFLAGSHIGAVGMTDTRGSAAAFLAVAINLGSAMGPLLGFTVIEDHYGTLLIVAVGLVLAALVLILSVIRKRHDGGVHGRAIEEVLKAVGETDHS